MILLEDIFVLISYATEILFTLDSASREVSSNELDTVRLSTNFEQSNWYVSQIENRLRAAGNRHLLPP